MRLRTNLPCIVFLPMMVAGCESRGGDSQVLLTLIDNMERENQASFTWGNNACNGKWFSAAPIDQIPYIRPQPRGDWYFDTPGARLSQYAAHLYSTQPLVASAPGVSGDAGPSERLWGANISIDLTQAFPSCYAQLDAGSMDSRPADLRAFSGLVFWAKASPSQTIHIMIHDQFSEPLGLSCNPDYSENRKGYECYDGFSLPLDLTETYTRYEVDFSDLQQDPTWGFQPPRNELDLATIYKIQFEVRNLKCITDRNARCAVDNSLDAGLPTLAFDFWIDDLYLVNRPNRDQ
jgi:hypothetical protein